jgi:hypothetical protein
MPFHPKGGAMACPQCHAVVRPVAEEVVSLPERPPAPTTKPTRASNPAFGLPLMGMAITAGMILLFCAGGGVLIYEQPYFRTSSYFNRFQTDNAYGATANAVEYLANKYDWPIRPGELLVAGVLMLVLARLLYHPK